MSNDDEISVALDDTGDEETTKRCDEGTNERGRDEGNNESHNFWP